MNFKVFVTIAAVFLTYCNASTLPSTSNAESAPKADAEIVQTPLELEPITLPKPFPVINETIDVVTNIQQCEDKSDQGFGGKANKRCKSSNRFHSFN